MNSRATPMPTPPRRDPQPSGSCGRRSGHRLLTTEPGCAPFNFSPGPAVLPLEVLEQAREELLDWHGSGMSVMEISHRGKAFMRGGGRGRGGSARTDGDTAQLQGAVPAGRRLGAVRLRADESHACACHRRLPEYRALVRKGIDGSAALLHGATSAADAGGQTITPGAARKRELRLQRRRRLCALHAERDHQRRRIRLLPETGGVPLVADMSSSILSRPVDVSKFGLIYAGAQKNIGPSGLTVVIVREDLIGRARPETPTVFDYKAVADDHSLLNTPPTFAWYMAGLVFKWLKKNGGVAAMGERNRIKAQALYAAIDGSALYRNSVAADSRSRMNVTFTLTSRIWTRPFSSRRRRPGCRDSRAIGVLGGMRASLYNAMPLAGVRGADRVHARVRAQARMRSLHGKP